MDKYVVFDVETPNSNNDRICAIGITVIEDNSIRQEQYYLVNPEVCFDDTNIKIHSIKPDMVLNSPNFKQIWDTIEPVMSSGLLVAHNAPFDMSVLAKCLNAYNIQWSPYVYYACTCMIGRRCMKEAPNHKLNTLCSILGINLNHHNAVSDSHACAELLLHYIDCGENIDDYIHSYDMVNIGKCYHNHKKLSQETQGLLVLKSLVEDVSEDGILSEDEIFILKKWMDSNQELRGNYPFDKIFSTIENALIDGVLEEVEISSMLQLFKQVTDPISNVCVCTDIDLKEKCFCLSGEFDYGEKFKVEEELIGRGGISQKGVNKKTNYLIVGGQGSSAWSAGNYGNKVKRALELQEQGSSIQIIREKDIF